ncbi:MAG: tetratricopeptide repeat protein [Ardenticatenaceae bacterium]|nr:tetratricopeptide repeat protein [Ardenticatenaceae bacterium]
MKENHFRLGDGEYQRFQQFISIHSGLQFPENRRGELEKGILEALANAPYGIKSVDRYFAFLSQSSDLRAPYELERLINILTIGETHFFRNTAHFEALANYILPTLIAKKREEANQPGQNTLGVPQLRIWSAGCSTGEEPYSIAMLLRELIPDIGNWRILILGTDINADALARARKAVYRDWSFREPGARIRRSRYFDHQDGHYSLHEDVRRQVTFAQHNLVEDDFPSPHSGIAAMDLIICRNVTIYFSQEITQRLIKKFYATLVDDGWFLVGHSEPSIVSYQEFKTHTFPKAILYQKQSSSAPDESVTSRKTDGRLRIPPQTCNLTDPHITERLKQATAKLHMAQTGMLGQSTTTAKLSSVARSRESSSAAGKSVAALYEEAQMLLVQGRAEKAIQVLENLLTSNENYGPAISLLARACADLGKHAEARAWCQRAIRNDSLNPRAYYILALLDENAGLIGQAIENFKKMIYIDANNPLPHFHLAVLYRKDGLLELSHHALTNSIKILQKLPKDQILPESGESVGWLLQTAQEMAKEKQQ